MSFLSMWSGIVDRATKAVVEVVSACEQEIIIRSRWKARINEWRPPHSNYLKPGIDTWPKIGKTFLSFNSFEMGERECEGWKLFLYSTRLFFCNKGRRVFC